MVRSRVTLDGAEPQPDGPGGSLARRIAAARGAGDPPSEGAPASRPLIPSPKKIAKSAASPGLAGTSVGGFLERLKKPGKNIVG
jgi:hypothetical protein